MRILIILLLLIDIIYGQDSILVQIDSYVKSMMKKTHTPGLSLALVKDDDIIFIKGFGKNDIDSNEKVNANTLFAIGSISKSFTAACLAKLVAEEQIDWDDNVIDYLPEFQLYDPWVTREFTIRDLLLHQTGYDQTAFGTLYYGTDLSRKEIVSRLKFLKPVSSFRSKVAYQNFTYMIAGLIIEKVTGKSWENYLRENLLIPLKMNRSFSKFEKTRTRKNLASPHLLKDDTIQKINHRNYQNIGPAGALYSTANEMAYYLKFILNHGVLNRDTLIAPEVLAEVFKPQVLFSTSPSGYNHYGFGWFITNRKGYKIVHHSGGVDGFSANIMTVPGLKIGVVILSNQEIVGLSAILWFIVGQYIGIENYDRSQQFFEWYSKYIDHKKEQIEELENNRIKGTKPSLKLKDFAGTYYDEMYGDLTISIENKMLKLSFQHSHSFTADLEHYHFNTFRLKWHDPTLPEGLILFNINSKNKITGFEFDIPRLLDADFKELYIKRKN